MLAAAIFFVAGGLWAGPWTDGIAVGRRDKIVVTYRARLQGDWLIVEAAHAPGWHTYAIDNVRRAAEASGKDKPETELPTRFDVGGGLRTVGNWLQEKPKNLTNRSIRWFTWGFEGVARFAIRVERREGASATVIVNGQACDAKACVIVEDVSIKIALRRDNERAAEDPPLDLSTLIEAPEPERKSRDPESSGS